MPGCASTERGHRATLMTAGLSALLAALLVACSAPAPGGKFEVRAVETGWNGSRLHVRIRQRLELSPTAREALEHGVPLTIELHLILRRESDRTRVLETTRRFEIRYLPLSEHYRVTVADSPDRNFPRLRHALGHLGTVELALEPGPLPSGDYEVLVQSRLDPGQLPPPMRLPARLRSDWAHRSGWTTWPFTAGNGA